MSRGDTERFIRTIAAVHSFRFSSLVLKKPEPKLDPYPLSTSARLSLVLRFLEPVRVRLRGTSMLEVLEAGPLLKLCLSDL